MRICASVDLDNYGEYRSLVAAGDDGRERSFYHDAVPRFLDLFDRNGAKATFFVIGRDAEDAAHRPILREIAARGHELANHSYSHPYNFRQLSRSEKTEEIRRAELSIADATGERPVGFRTPSCEVDSETLSVLVERGYLYDSSVFPSPIMWAFMLYGKLFVQRDGYQLGELASALAPTKPYFPRADKFHRAARPGGPAALPIVEIPFSVIPVVRVPFYSTLLRRLGPRAFSVLRRMYGRKKPVLHTLFHLIELADFDGTPLGEAYRRMPALSIGFDARQRFLEHAVREMCVAGAAVTLSDLARTYASTGQNGPSA